MTTTLLRSNFAAVAVKVETTVGTDVIAGTPVAADWLQAACEISLNPIVIDSPGYTGSLDRAVSSVGGFQPTLTLTVPFRGSGTAGTEPTLTRLLKACTMAVTNTAAAVGAPTAAASGTETTVTAASPFGTTADQYNGMPLLVTGDQTFTTGIMDYTAGRVITMGETRAAALTTSSLLQIPINDRFAPTSDESVFKTVTIYVFKDGRRWKFVGCTGTFSLELRAGASGVFTFQMQGQLAADPDNTALPAGAATALNLLPAMPRWVAGKSQLNKKTARCNSLRLDFGVANVVPPNPERDYGIDSAIPVSRSINGVLDPMIDTDTADALWTAFEAGTDLNLMAIIGSTAGNRMLVAVPAARMLNLNPSDSGGLQAHNIPFQANGNDTGAYITFF